MLGPKGLKPSFGEQLLALSLPVELTVVLLGGGTEPLLPGQLQLREISSGSTAPLLEQAERRSWRASEKRKVSAYANVKILPEQPPMRYAG